MNKILFVIPAILISIFMAGVGSVYAGESTDVFAAGVSGTNEIRVDSSGRIVMVNGETISNATDGTLAITDGTNTLMTVVDAGTTGNVTATGTITSTGMSASGSTVNINVDSNFATNINTGTSNGALSLGGGSGTVAVNSSDWDISATGAMTGIGAITCDGLITGSAGATVTGATVSINANANNNINLCTGTSTGTVTIGAGLAQAAFDTTNWDISTTGGVTGITLGSYKTTPEILVTSKAPATNETGEIYAVTSASITVTLPANPTTGLIYTVTDVSGNAFSLDPNGTDRIMWKTCALTDGNKMTSSGTTGECVTVVCYTANTWAIKSLSGTFSDGGA